MIQDQVKLPLNVAFGIVIQGIRIRFGRSMITIAGVVLGIAFLVSTLTGQAVKQAVQDEDLMRAEVKRMASFLEAEMGPPLDQTVGVIQTGPLAEQEQRLLRLLADGGLRALNWHDASGEAPALRLNEVKMKDVAVEAVAENAGSVIVMGDGTLPPELNDPARLARLFEKAAGRVLAATREQLQPPAASGLSVVSLARQMTPEEIAKVDQEKQQARFRRNWIVLISILVTVTGIANAMLMSVTERFREIGTMKCLGALSTFIRWIFFFESSLIGAVGGAAGSLLGIVFSLGLYGFSYGYGAVFTSVSYASLSLYFLMGIAAGVALSVVAAIYPASVASRMVPANALRTNV